jgi:hypothetical protein
MIPKSDHAQDLQRAIEIARADYRLKTAKNEKLLLTFDGVSAPLSDPNRVWRIKQIIEQMMAWKEQEKDTPGWKLDSTPAWNRIAKYIKEQQEKAKTS